MKKIIHIQFTGPYTEGQHYQENILPKYHKQYFDEVEMWATCYSWKGNEIIEVEPLEKIMKDGVKLKRFPFHKLGSTFLTKKIRFAKGVYKALMESNPNCIMMHDIQTHSALAIAKYVRNNPNVTLIVDGHTDYLNSAKNIFSKYILHKVLYKFYAKKIETVAKVFWGTLPSRNIFMQEMYNIKPEKCKLLLMGAEDSIVENATKHQVIADTRKELAIGEQQIMIVTGGKINDNRPEVLDLMEAINDINDPNIKLVIFGLVDDSMKHRFEMLLDKSNIIFIGWKPSDETYKYLAAADLAVFPGLHSVMWEQTVALGTPGIFRDLEGFHHIDIGGNVSFITDTSKEGLKKELLRLTNSKDSLKKMKKAANSEMRKEFMYSVIAQRCLQ